MKKARIALFLSLSLGAAIGVSSSSASAGQGPLYRRGGYAYDHVVSPAMMHAIDVIVAEKMKMRRHAR